MASILHLLSPLAADFHTVCSMLGVAKYCSYLCLFSWMVSVSFDIYHVVHASMDLIQENPQRSITKQACMTWFIPCVVSCGIYSLEYIPSLPEHYKPQFGSDSCWFRNKHVLLYYFIFPVTMCVTLNIVIFISVSYALHKSFTLTEDVQENKENRHTLF